MNMKNEILAQMEKESPTPFAVGDRVMILGHESAGERSIKREVGSGDHKEFGLVVGGYLTWFSEDSLTHVIGGIDSMSHRAERRRELRESLLYHYRVDNVAPGEKIEMMPSMQEKRQAYNDYRDGQREDAEAWDKTTYGDQLMEFFRKSSSVPVKQADVPPVPETSVAEERELLKDSKRADGLAKLVYRDLLTTSYTMRYLTAEKALVRTVTPIAVLYNKNSLEWGMMAWCSLREDYRRFSLSSVAGMDPVPLAKEFSAGDVARAIADFSPTISRDFTYGMSILHSYF